MNCAEVMEWMHRYLDHDLSQDESLEMFRHIDECPSCAELFERLNALSGELERLPDVSPPFSLVDSILPKLEAIDREAPVIADPPVQENGSQPLSRKASRAKGHGGSFSSMGARIGIGAAAAAVILCVAIFNMPEKLPGALVDDMMKSQSAHNEELNKGMDAGGGDPSSRSSESFEIESPSALEDGRMEQGGESATPEDSGMSALIAPESPLPSSEGQGTEQGGSPEAGTPTKKAQKNQADQPARSEASPGNRNNPSKQPATPSPSPQAPASSEADSTGETGDQDNRKSIGDPGQSPSSDANDTNDMGIMYMTPMKTQEGPASWTSPDGRYMAVVDGQQLIIYRAAGDGSGERQAAGTIAIEGTWVSGKWTEDSRLFTYVTTVEGREAHGIYALPEESAEPAATPSETPVASPSPDASTK